MKFLSDTDTDEMKKLMDDIIQNEIELFKVRAEHRRSLNGRLKRYGIFMDKDLTGMETQMWLQQFIPKKILNDDEQSFEDKFEFESQRN